jgi:MFS family permease
MRRSMSESADRSYRALFAIPDMGRIVVSMQLARIAQAMVGVVVVLFTLNQFDSPQLAGIVTFASLAPGIAVSPIAGALLDRYHRIRLIRLDYMIAFLTMVLIGGLSLAGQLSPALLIAIAAISSLTGPLSQTGLRSLFPLIVPEHLWERVNAVDSNGYLIASIIGPPLSAVLFVLLGPQAAVIAVGIPYSIATLALIGVSEPAKRAMPSAHLVADVVAGLRYAWNNRTIRGLIFAIGALNVASGVLTIVVPVLVLDQLHAPEIAVGLAFAVSGVAGVISVLAFGRVDSRGKEWRLLVYPMVLVIPAYALLFVANTDAAVAAPAIGLAAIAMTMLVLGLANGPLDIGLFTIRQRRTDPALMGRAFAISMALNFSGFPVGAALAGVLSERSMDLAILAAVIAAAVGTIFAAVLVPRHAAPEPAPQVAPEASAGD